MAESENGLLAIEVDADDYAETAAGDAPSVSRTYQSEADFQAIKATYQAKQDGGTTYQDLISAVPVLSLNNVNRLDGHVNGDYNPRFKLSKKDFQLLTYAVGEMYFDKKYETIVGLCGRVRERCELDVKIGESLERWEQRSRQRINGGVGSKSQAATPAVEGALVVGARSSHRA